MSKTNFLTVQNKCQKNNFFSKKDIIPLDISNVQKIPKYFYNEMFRSKKILFSRKFFRKCRVQFWQPCRKKYLKLQKCIAKIRKSRWKKLLSNSVYKTSFFQKSFQKKFSWHVKCNFVTLDKTTASSLQINLGEKRKTPEKQVIFSKKNIFHQ